MKKTRTELAANGLPVNLHNPYQGAFRRVLCICSGGILRSATTAELLARSPYYCNTRAAGIDEPYALVSVDRKLVEWADEIICMEPEQERMIKRLYPDTDKPITCLGISDSYAYFDPRLVKLIHTRLAESQFNVRLAAYLFKHPQLRKVTI